MVLMDQGVDLVLPESYLRISFHFLGDVEMTLMLLASIIVLNTVIIITMANGNLELNNFSSRSDCSVGFFVALIL